MIDEDLPQPRYAFKPGSIRQHAGRIDRRTGIPVLLNTSFNENEPIVHSPQEAMDCFLRTKMDVLAIGPFLCRKERQDGANAGS